MANLKHRKFDASIDVSKFKVTAKEMARASEDDVVVVVRPQSGGGIGVFALDMSDPAKPKNAGINWYEVEDKSDLPDAIRELNRDLDKFRGKGGRMSDRGRLRDKGPKTEAASKPATLDDKAAAELYRKIITADPARRASEHEADMDLLRKLSGIPKDAQESVNEDDSIGRTIADQMGGAGKMRAMLGATIVAIPNGLAIKWPNKTRSKGNLVQITLEPSDTYKMVFYNAAANVRTGGKKVVKEYEDVYFDQLVDIFEKQTGWYLRM